MEIRNFNFKKKYGQNFLIDSNITDKIANVVKDKTNSLVIEIGCGDGRLTKKLCLYYDNVLCYEIDEEVIPYLKDNLKEYNNYNVILGDFLKRDISLDIKNYNYDKLYVIANLPYYITTPIISKFILELSCVNEIVIMVQKEVADRLSADVGTRDYGQLTVFLNYYFNMEKMFDVNRKCFYPSPNVDSAVIKMTRRESVSELVSFDHFEKLVKDAFKFKRKTIKNNLINKYDLDIVIKVLEKYGMDISTRSEKIPYYVFVEMSNELLK